MSNTINGEMEFPEVTQIESALLELELIGTEEDGKKTQNLLTTKLLALGVRVPVTMTREKGVVRLRAVLPGSRAADVAYQLEAQVIAKSLINSL